MNLLLLLQFNFMIQDFSLNMKLINYSLIDNIHLDGTVSQILDIGLRFDFMRKNGKILLIFSSLIFYI